MIQEVILQRPWTWNLRTLGRWVKDCWDGKLDEDCDLSYENESCSPYKQCSCKRHAIYAVNGEIKAINISEGPEDPAGDDDPSATLADAMIAAIEGST